jgi:hypothetical protein
MKHKIISVIALLVFSLGNAQAALVNYTITGIVVLGEDNYGPNAFGLNENDTITAFGTFDDSALTGGAGTVTFGSGSGNTMTISVGTATYTASDDIDFALGDPSITFTSLTSISDFDYLASDFSFNSLFTSFDDYGNLFGDWITVEVTAIPVPAAVWLFGSGLIGLAGVARRKKSRV